MVFVKSSYLSYTERNFDTLVGGVTETVKNNTLTGSSRGVAEEIFLGCFALPQGGVLEKWGVTHDFTGVSDEFQGSQGYQK